MSYAGNARIGGTFTNNGLVSAAPTGLLTFEDVVTGPGGYGGDILFQAGLRPGTGWATVSFHGGNAGFAAGSVLSMEVFGALPGGGYDQLTGIEQFDFNGTLDLIFGNGFVPLAGAVFNLFDFNRFSGSFEPSMIAVTGFERTRLDFSSLSVTGELRVLDAAATPLPTTAWLSLLGLAALRFARRSTG